MRSRIHPTRSCVLGLPETTCYHILGMHQVHNSLRNTGRGESRTQDEKAAVRRERFKLKHLQDLHLSNSEDLPSQSRAFPSMNTPQTLTILLLCGPAFI